MGKSPELIIIGAQKAGTTWLTQNLSIHQDIWIPPTKEIHYFDNLWPNSFLLNYLARVYTNNTNSDNIDFEKMMWFAKFALERPRTDDWYRELFTPAKDRVAVDCTPAYSMLNEEQVKHAAFVAPNAKILFILRNPVDRIWSHFNFSAPWRQQGILDGDLTTEEILSEINTAPYHLRTDYTGTLKLWETYYPKNQILVLFYDQLKDDPQIFLNTIFNYVNLPLLEKSEIAIATSAVNVTQNALPRRTQVDIAMAKKYLEMVKILSKKYGKYPQGWLSQFDDFINLTDASNEAIEQNTSYSPKSIQIPKSRVALSLIAESIKRFSK